MDYKLYITSDDWKRVAEKVKERAKWRCQLCAETANLDAHHNSYEHLGDEENHMEDLVCLCRQCHAKHHGKTPPKIGRYKKPEKPICLGTARNLSRVLQIPIPSVFDIPPRTAEKMELTLSKMGKVSSTHLMLIEFMDEIRERGNLSQIPCVIFLLRYLLSHDGFGLLVKVEPGPMFVENVKKMLNNSITRIAP